MKCPKKSLRFFLFIYNIGNMKKTIWISVFLAMIIAVVLVYLHLHVTTKNRTESSNSNAPDINSAVVEKIKGTGELLFKKRRVETLIATYEGILKSAPSAATRKTLASTYLELSKIEKALGHEDAAEKNRKKATELDPEIGD